MTSAAQLSASELARLLPYRPLIDSLQMAFRDWPLPPNRHHHRLDSRPNGAGLLLMPAWSPSYFAVKIVGIFPRNPERGLPTIRGTILLCSAEDGETLAVLDAGEVTARRTAAASALAAGYLAREDAASLLLVGSGRLIPYLAEAHVTARPIRRVIIWARDGDKAHAAADSVRRALGQEIDAVVEANLEEAVRRADIVSTATGSTQPLILGEWLRAGTHLDLIGSYRDGMREADGACLERSTLFVDTREGALAEAGEIIEAIRKGHLDANGIAADLAELARGEHPGRRSAGEITMFKSVGCATEDLAASILAYQRALGC